MTLDGVALRRVTVPAVMVIAAIGIAPSSSAADTIAYPMSDLQAAFLSDADIKGLAQWGSFQPTTPAGTECSAYAKGGYVCLRDYPLHQFGSRPYYLKVISLPDPAQAQREFALAQASALAAAQTTLSLDSTSYSVVRRDYADAPYRIVRSGRLVGNHYVEASCWGAADRYRAEDINTCTQLMIGAQVNRLSGLVSPRVTPPGSPTDVLVDAQKGRVTVTWLAPDSDGGAPITEYRATSSAGDLACTASPTTATVQSCSVDGARPGVRYVFTVTALNSAGASAPSGASQPVGFTTRPGSPRSARVSSAGTTATIRWKAPQDRGGLPITRYVVRDNRGDTVCSTTQVTCSVSDLSYATRYRFAVSAVNARGDGPRQWTTWIRTPQPPAAPPVTPTPDAPKPEQSLS